MVQWDDSHIDSLDEASNKMKASCATGINIPEQIEEICLVTEL